MSSDTLTKKSLENDFIFKFQEKRINTKSPCFYVTSTNLSKEINNQIYIQTSTSNPFPPWQLHKANINYNIQKEITKKDPEHIIRTIAVEILNTSWQNQLKIFTDGSKDENGRCAAAFVVPELKIKKQYRLPDNKSIHSAELIAILMVIEWLEDVRPLSTVILVDSMSALQSIQSKEQKNDIVSDILFKLTILKYQGLDISFEWVPSHVNIAGNEMADKAAKRALDDPINIQVNYTPKEKKSIIKAVIQKQWQQQWDAENCARHFYKIQQKITKTIPINISRQTDTLFTKLRLGYCPLNKHLQKLQKHQTGLCDYCQKEETVEHYILQCSRYSKERYEFQNRLTKQGIDAYNLKSILQRKSSCISAVIAYINKTNRFGKTNN